MASICLSTASTSKTLAIAPPHAAKMTSSSASTSHGCSCLMESVPNFSSNRLIPNNRMAQRLVVPQFGFSRLIGHNQRAKRQVVRMAPEEEKLTRRSPLDFPIEWEKPKPARRPDIFPQFSPMKTPLPPPLPCDPPEEDEEEEEKKEEEEEDPDKEDPDKEESGNSNFQ